MTTNQATVDNPLISIHDVHITPHFRQRCRQICEGDAPGSNIAAIALAFGREITDLDEVARLTNSNPKDPSHTKGSRYFVYLDKGILVLSPTRKTSEDKPLRRPWVAVTLLPLGGTP